MFCIEKVLWNKKVLWKPEPKFQIESSLFRYNRNLLEGFERVTEIPQEFKSTQNIYDIFNIMIRKHFRTTLSTIFKWSDSFELTSQ